MASSRSASIIDLKPFLARFRREQADPTRPETGSDLADLVDDPPAPPDRARRVHAGITVTWRLFVGVLLVALGIGAAVTAMIPLVDPYLARQHYFIFGLLVMTAAILTASTAYWAICLLTSHWLGQLDTDSPPFSAPQAEGSAPVVHRLQATQIDRLLETVSRLMEELRFQLDSQKRGERNDLIRTITALARALEARDPYTQNHSRSVARLSVRLGREIGLPREQLYEIHLAGLLHDIGKIGVPDEVLMKPGRLTDAEMKQVQSHVEWSWNILSPITTLGQVGLIVRHHHERFDGQGYPDRLAGESIPLGSRIMAVADMFVAMTEDRPYRKGLPVQVAVAELRRVAGTQVDPALVATFLDALEEEDSQEVDSGSKSAAAN